MNLKTEESTDITEFKQEEKKQKHYFDKRSRIQRPLEINEPVRIYDNGNFSKHGTVIQEDDQTPRSYIVRSDEGAILRRNRSHLKPVPPLEIERESRGTQPTDVHLPPQPQVIIDFPSALSQIKNPQKSPVLRRSTRTSRVPKRLMEEK